MTFIIQKSYTHRLPAALTTNYYRTNSLDLNTRKHEVFTFKMYEDCTYMTSPQLAITFSLRMRSPLKNLFTVHHYHINWLHHSSTIIISLNVLFFSSMLIFTIESRDWSRHGNFCLLYRLTRRAMVMLLCHGQVNICDNHIKKTSQAASMFTQAWNSHAAWYLWSIWQSIKRYSTNSMQWKFVPASFELCKMMLHWLFKLKCVTVCVFSQILR